MERDHGHVKQRLYPMLASSKHPRPSHQSRAYPFRNLRNGFSTRTASVPINL
jgi:hypothetical protein